MRLWQRILFTLVAILLASFLAGLAWHWIFGAEMPTYLSGLVGGIVAIPVWELLSRLHFAPKT